MGKVIEQAEEHWSYIGALLKKHESNSNIALIKFHYITAFIHGHKHGMKEMEDLIMKPKFD